MPPLQYGDILQLYVGFVEHRLARGLAEKRPPADDGSSSAGGPVILRICLRILPVRIRPAVDFHSIAHHFLSKFCSIVWTKSAQPRLYQGSAGLVVFYHIHFIVCLLPKFDISSKPFGIWAEKKRERPKTECQFCPSG